MYSLQDDTVLDPFLGTGTTAIAAIMTGRNSIGYEIDKAFVDVIYENICSTSLLEMNAVIRNRIDRHRTFIVNRLRDNKEIKHHNGNLNMPVVTSQETEIRFSYLSNINFTGKTEVSVEYSDIAIGQNLSCKDNA